ncbi:hypothetical protein MMC10_005678 [Thelotrema lepadinum]|nr:hypothetical protein [Thelotrema lepadinum]
MVPKPQPDGPKSQPTPPPELSLSPIQETPSIAPKSQQKAPKQRRCIHCQKDASLSCSGGCAGKTSEHDEIKARYCSSECQKADWKVHKGLCDPGKFLEHAHTRKKLHSAAKILQDVFYASSESTFGFDVGRAERRDQKIHMYTSPNHNWKPPFQFPVQFAWTEDEKQKLLSFGRCADAHVVTQGLLKKLLGGMSRYLEAIRGSFYELTQCAPIDLYGRARLSALVLTSYEQSIVIHGQEIFDTGGSHNVWFLGLKDGSSFIIDLAGAQFGHHDIVVPASRYEMLYQPRYQHSIGVDYVREEYSSQLSGPFGSFLLGDSGTAMAKHDLLSGQIIDETAAAWERANMITLAELLDLPDQDLYDKSTNLVERIRNALDQRWVADRAHTNHSFGDFIRKHT